MESFRLQMPGLSALTIRGPVTQLMQVVASMAVLMIAAPALAQTDGGLVVYVIDGDEIPAKDVSVTLSGPSLLGGSQTKVSGIDGQVQFTKLQPAADYVLSASSDYLQPSTLNGVTVKIGSKTNVTVKMDAIEVIVADNVEKAVDVSSSSRGQVLTKEFLSRVPSGRSYQQATQLVKGAGQNGADGFAGGADNENTYMVDGVNVTDPVSGTFGVNFNFDAIQQIEVLLGGYMPEYGVSIGGVVNIVTDSGSNNLSFNSSVYYINGNLRPRIDERIGSDGVLLAPSGFENSSLSMQIGAVVSGPIVRDKAFFILSYQHVRNLFSGGGTLQRRDFDGNYVYGKLTLQPSSEHRFSAALQIQPTNVDNGKQYNPFVKAESQSRQSQGGVVASGRWDWFLSPDMNLSTLASYQTIYLVTSSVPCTHDRTQDKKQCRPGEAENTIDWYTPGRQGTGGAFDSVNDIDFNFIDRTRLEVSTKLSITNVEDPFGGKHDLKFGISTEQVSTNTITGYNGNLAYRDTNAVSFDPTTFTNLLWFETSAPIKYRQTGSIYSFFLQDSWKPVPNLTINYGTRFDNAVMRNDLGDATLRGNLFGPRLFAAWDPFGDQRTKIGTGFGRFNDRGTLGISGFTDQSGFGQKIWFGEITENFTNTTEENFQYNPVRNLNVAAENLSNPHTDEVILLLEREVIRDVAVFSEMSGKFSRNLFEFDDSNWILSGNGDSIIGARTGDIDTFRGRLRTPTLARRDTFQWDLGFRKVWSDRWAAVFSYTFLQAYGSSSQSLSGSFANDPQTQFNYGRLFNSQNHSFVGQLIFDLPFDPWTPQIGIVLRGAAGQPEERFYYAARGNSGQGGQAIRLRPRGGYTRSPGYWELRVRYTQQIDVRKGQLGLSVELQNLTNNRAGQFTNQNQIDQNNRYVLLNRQDPFTVQLGATYKF